MISFSWLGRRKKIEPNNVEEVGVGVEYFLIELEEVVFLVVQKGQHQGAFRNDDEGQEEVDFIGEEA